MDLKVHPIWWCAFFMAIITIEQLKKKLRWENIRHQIVEDTFSHITVVPDGKDLSCIRFVFDYEITYLECLGFSEWHAHYCSYDNETKNIVEAIHTARRLVNKNLCLAEHTGEDDKYLSGELLKPDELPTGIFPEVKYIKRRFFNEEPKIEEVDFSKYIKLKYLFVLRTYKEEIEGQCGEAGIKPPFAE
jgi:hypothetical protein